MRASIGRRSAALGWAFGPGGVPELILDVAATSKMRGDVAATSHVGRGPVILAGMRTTPTARAARATRRGGLRCGGWCWPASPDIVAAACRQSSSKNQSRGGSATLGSGGDGGTPPGPGRALPGWIWEARANQKWGGKTQRNTDSIAESAKAGMRNEPKRGGAFHGVAREARAKIGRKTQRNTNKHRFESGKCEYGNAKRTQRRDTKGTNFHEPEHSIFDVQQSTPKRRMRSGSRQVKAGKTTFLKKRPSQGTENSNEHKGTDKKDTKGRNLRS